MTNKEAAAMLESMKNYFLPTSPMLEEQREIKALDLAISALSKQSASCDQAFKRRLMTYLADLKLTYSPYPKGDEKLEKLYEFIGDLMDEVESWDEMVDQFREDTKMTDSERVSLLEQKKSNSFLKEPSEDSNSEMNSTKFKPGDKFILELGQERKMFGEFEIKGTDLYVRTDLLEKLTRYEPEENATADKILIDLAEAIEIVKFECGEWKGLAQTIVNGLKKLSPKQSEKIPYKKPEIIHCESCKHWTHTPLNGYGLGKCDFHDDDLVTRYGSCGYAERRNDG